MNNRQNFAMRAILRRLSWILLFACDRAFGPGQKNETIRLSEPEEVQILSPRTAAGGARGVGWGTGKRSAGRRGRGCTERRVAGWRARQSGSKRPDAKSSLGPFVALLSACAKSAAGGACGVGWGERALAHL